MINTRVNLDEVTTYVHNWYYDDPYKNKILKNIYQLISRTNSNIPKNVSILWL